MRCTQKLFQRSNSGICLHGPFAIYLWVCTLKQIGTNHRLVTLVAGAYEKAGNA